MSDESPDTPPRSPPAREVFAYFRHELRTPVNAVIGYSEMLLEDAAESPALRAPLERIRGLGKRLLGAINEQLAPARSEGADAARLEEVADDVRAALRPPVLDVLACCEELRAGGEADAVADDVDRIRTAGQNLLALLGSLRLSPGGEGAPRVFDVEPGEAEFLPEAPATPAASGHVLVVDDDRFNRDLLARGLFRQGHHFGLAASGTQALEMLKSKAFDLVLLDVMMPGLSGIEVLARLKADPELRELPVIMISALDEMDGVVRCIEMGAVDYLPKPFNPILLKARVGASLEKKRLRDRELEYLRQVATLTAAAAALEAAAFAPESLTEVTARGDELGTLARVFERMAREVQAREDKLKKEVQALRVEIDEARKARQVDEITQTDYFQQLRQKAQTLRERRDKRETPA